MGNVMVQNGSCHYLPVYTTFLPSIEPREIPI